MEVQEAASKLKKNRAYGPDYVPNELLKYACASNETAQWIECDCGRQNTPERN